MNYEGLFPRDTTKRKLLDEEWKRVRWQGQRLQKQMERKETALRALVLLASLTFGSAVGWYGIPWVWNLIARPGAASTASPTTTAFDASSMNASSMNAPQRTESISIKQCDLFSAPIGVGRGTWHSQDGMTWYLPDDAVVSSASR